MERHSNLAAQQLAFTMKRLYLRGLISGIGGNASVRLSSDRILITPSGYFKGGIAKGELVEVTLEGKIIRGKTPSSELQTHLIAYRKRRDISAVVHGHPPTAVALITSGFELKAVTPEHAAAVHKLQVVDFATPGKEGANAVSKVLETCDVVGIKNHGFFAFAKTLHDAASKIEVLEESAKIYIAMMQLGSVSILSDEQVAKIRAQYKKE
ncbi:MAG: class II aldolase/adducin family protein [Nitrososphaerota archaeon]